MATGKSSVGKCLAALMGYDFFDLDASIEAEEGTSIPEIFASKGEAAFRALEAGMVDRVMERSRCVIATGGGTIINPLNLEKLKKSGILINLTANIDTIIARAGSGTDRPMLQQGDRRERIRSLLEQRAHAYAQADIAIDTSALTIEEVARRIMAQLQSQKT